MRRLPVRLAYRLYEAVGGSDKKMPPVVFMHAMLCSKEIWDVIPQYVAEQTKRKVFVYDARNHGESEFTKEYSFDDNLIDLYNFMNGMKIKKSALVGHSMGGMTAISAALQTPDRVDKAFIVDMYVRKVDEDLINDSMTFMQTWTDIVRNLPKNTPPTELTRISVRMLYDKLPEDMRWTSEMEGYLLSRFLYFKRLDGGFDVGFHPKAIMGALIKYRDSPMTQNESINMLANSPTLRNFIGRDYPDITAEPKLVYTGQYHGPAYFIYGERSPFFVDDEEEDIKKHFPKAEMIEMKKASHHLFADYPEKFAKILVDKLNRY